MSGLVPRRSRHPWLLLLKLLLLTGDAPTARSSIYEWILLRARGYIQNGHEVRVLAPLPNSQSHPQEHEVDGVTVQRAAASQAVAIAKDFSPQHVLVHHVSEWTLAVSTSLSLPITFWIYGPEVLFPSDYYEKPGPFTRFFLNFLDRARTSKIKKQLLTGKKLVCTSSYAAERLSLFLPKSKGEVIYTPVQVPPPRVKEQEGILKGLALEHLGHRTLVSSGIDLLIQAYRNPSDTTLTLAGNGGALEDLRRWIARENSAVELKVLEPGADMMKLMQQFDYFVVASRFNREIFRACQAMACGLPVVAPKAWAFPELVVDGQTGFTFEPGNPISLKKGISMIVNNHPLLSMTSRLMVEKCCDYQDVIQKELQMISGGV